MTEPHFHGQAGVRIAGTGLGLPEGRLTNADRERADLRNELKDFTLRMDAISIKIDANKAELKKEAELKKT
ncbi:MAG: hypothetical protein QF351_05320, partial [Phycisphaerales bacterium]|nr:hypothetical protein [Phycisphaerales bacterium]